MENGRYIKKEEIVSLDTEMLKEVRDHLTDVATEIKDVVIEIKGITKEMQSFNATIRLMTDPKDGYVALIAGKKQMPVITHVITTSALAICLVAAILALTNSNMNYGDFHIGQRAQADVLKKGNP